MSRNRHSLAASYFILALAAASPAAADNNAVIENVLVNDLAASADPGINAIQAALAGASSVAEQDAVLEAASPVLHGGEAEAIRSINRQTFGLINQRLALLRENAASVVPAESGVSTGNGVDLTALEAWWQFYGSGGTQDTRDDTGGYKSTIYGIAGGIEAEVTENGFLGLNFSWGETEVDSKGAGDAVSDIDTYMVGLYGDYDFGGAYVNAMLSYGYNDIYTAKNSAAGKRTGNFHAGNVAARLEGGKVFMTGKTRLIPKLMALYNYYSPDSYIEEGPAAQSIAGNNVKSFELGAGLDMSWLMNHDVGSYFIPEMRLGYRYDLAGDAVVTQTQFTAGGPVFVMQGPDPAAHAFDFGLGMTYLSREEWEIKLGYDLEYKRDYVAHAGMVRAAYKFHH